MFQNDTQGSIGIENELEQEDIDRADMIILAVSIQIEEEERFENKNIYYGNVDEAISYPERVVDKALKHYGLLED